MSDEIGYEVKKFRMDPEFIEAARHMIEMDMGYAPGTLEPYEPPSDPGVRAALEQIRKDDERAFFGL